MGRISRAGRVRTLSASVGGGKDRGKFGAICAVSIDCAVYNDCAVYIDCAVYNDCITIVPCITEAWRSWMAEGSSPGVLGEVLELGLGLGLGRRVPGMRIWKLGTEVLYTGRVKGRAPARGG